MRIATFNLENLDLPPKAALPLETRAEVLRPELQRLRADVLCLQEVNGQHIHGQPGRHLVALDALLEGTEYAGFNRAVSHVQPQGREGTAQIEQSAPISDVHNLVTLSRYPIVSVREIRHDFVPPIAVPSLTADPAPAGPLPLRFERTLLVTDLDIGAGKTLTVVNLHLRAPLAAAVPGQKLKPFVWKSVSGWAEGYLVSGIKRSAQAFELRLALDAMLDDDPHRLIAVAGDFNAEDHETPLKIIVGAAEDTGNGALEPRSLVVLDRSLAADRRWSVLHHGRPQMLDHILASRSLVAYFRDIEVHNEAVPDEAVGYARIDRPPGSMHAAVVAEFTL